MILSVRVARMAADSRSIREGGSPKASRSNQLRRAEILGRLEQRRAVAGLLVLEDLALEVPNDDTVGIAAQDVWRVDRHLAAAAGRVDHVLRNAVAGGVAAQGLHDLEALPDGGAQ